MDAVAIVVSGRPQYFRQTTDALIAQTRGFQSLVVVPWGPDSAVIEDIARRLNVDVTIVERSSDNTLEGSRNNALSALAPNPPDWVAFLDDDTTLGPQWLEEMTEAVEVWGADRAFASLMAYASDCSVVQSAGHVLDGDARPLDCEYGKDMGKVPTPGGSPPLCPCGNSAFVPWKAITSIKACDEQIWDPRFRQWQTCFDFGLKLRIVGFDCQLVTTALATHAGSCVLKPCLNEQQVMSQLRSRLLLYDKFFPEDERAKAMQALRTRVYGRWKSKGFPSAQWLEGERLVSVFEKSLVEEEGLRGGMSRQWLVKVKELDTARRRHLLFGG